MCQKNNKSQKRIEDLLKKIEELFGILSANPGTEKIIQAVIDNMRTALISQLKMAINLGSSIKKIRYEDLKIILEIYKSDFGMYDFAELYENGNSDIRKAVLDICPNIEKYISKTEENSLFSTNNSQAQSIG
ncbi:MAG TPA: hypothetical protein PLA41_02025 [Candidatus Pacearchaeota archaeon]|nr:hypothetical protein [Candidatus Parcubacteria bacterium]HNZ84016.1 hypothetical protein [Candidatus Pacearchaeota archaeon]HOU45906.1 hypothetical protein [Candidatus Pacearchaeota archaeon]HPM08199.1 hypothetical protein [Candidatus Pacearchaeota archaeon]HQI74481.1 hypothetical protein [Candidatus Pacearchaeota archaeon]